jgi:hypothetical protein
VNLVKENGQLLNLVDDDDLVLWLELLTELGRSAAERQKDVAVEKVRDFGSRQSMSYGRGLARLPRPEQEEGLTSCELGEIEGAGDVRWRTRYGC